MSAFDVWERRVAHDRTDGALFNCLAHFEKRHWLSVDRLALTESPVESIGSSFQCHHPDALVCRISTRIAGHDNRIAHLQGLAGNPGAAQLAGSSPLDVPDHFFAVFVDGGDMKKRVGIPKKKLSNLAFNGYSLSRV